MILVLGGTLEGREIASALAERKHKVLITVVSDYGAELIPRAIPVEVLVKALDMVGLKQLFQDRQISLVIDATHPYACAITENACEAAEQAKIPYIRFERPPVSQTLDESRAMVYPVSDFTAGAELSVTLGETIFLTIGSRHLEPFVIAGCRNNKRVVARVLPDSLSIEQCVKLGMAPKDIVAVQGPFSLEMNLAMLREYKAGVLVTKDSGKVGGTDTKLEAAAQLGLPAVMVTRPEGKDIGISVSDSIEQLIWQVETILGNQSR